MDGRNPAPPKKPWNNDSLANSNKQWLPIVSNTNKEWFPMVSKWCRISSIHSMIRHPLAGLQPAALVPAQDLLRDHHEGEEPWLERPPAVPKELKKPKRTRVSGYFRIPLLLGCRKVSFCPLGFVGN